jgi:hypothetical protein
MIKRSSSDGLLDDVTWLQRFTSSCRAQGTSRGLGDTVLGFMPGLWRTINNKSAFAQTLIASAGSDGSSSPARYHPET